MRLMIRANVYMGKPDRSSAFLPAPPRVMFTSRQVSLIDALVHSLICPTQSVSVPGKCSAQSRLYSLKAI